ncbi:MAG: hypothetical protein LUC41_06025 [Clostridiales bacterium]|nr:hypothetical protein [Clostridiales bacterium]
MVRWQSVNDGETVTQYYLLENYFDDSELQALYDHCEENPEASGRLCVSEMDGYYKYSSLGIICPVRVVFTDNETGEVVCDLQTSDYRNGNVKGELVTRLAQLPDDVNQSDDSVELGYFSRYIYMSSGHSTPPAFNVGIIDVNESSEVMYDGTFSVY